MLQRVWLWIRVGLCHLVYWVIGAVPESHHSRLAGLYFDLGKWRDCIKHSKRYLEYRESDQFQAILGFCYGNMGNREDAVESYRSISNPYKDPALALGLAEAELNAGNLAKAKEIVAVIEISHDQSSSATKRSLEYLNERIKGVQERGQDV